MAADLIRQPMDFISKPVIFNAKQIVSLTLLPVREKICLLRAVDKKSTYLLRRGRQLFSSVKSIGVLLPYIINTMPRFLLLQGCTYSFLFAFIEEIRTK